MKRIDPALRRLRRVGWLPENVPAHPMLILQFSRSRRLRFVLGTTSQRRRELREEMRS